MKNKGLNILNNMIFAFTGIFVGHVICLYRNIDFYKSQSISWYEDLLYWGVLWLIEIVVCLIIRHKIKKIEKLEKE